MSLLTLVLNPSDSSIHHQPKSDRSSWPSSNLAKTMFRILEGDFLRHGDMRMLDTAFAFIQRVTLRLLHFSLHASRPNVRAEGQVTRPCGPFHSVWRPGSLVRSAHCSVFLVSLLTLVLNPSDSSIHHQSKSLRASWSSFHLAKTMSFASLKESSSDTATCAYRTQPLHSSNA